jgi:hypothetical protein
MEGENSFAFVCACMCVGSSLEVCQLLKLPASAANLCIHGECDRDLARVQHKKGAKNKQTNSVALSDRHLSVKLVPTLADGGCARSAQRVLTAVNFGFLDRSHYFSIQVVPQLSSRG